MQLSCVLWSLFRRCVFLQGCRSVEEFQCLNRIEEGTYGVVYRAKDKKTGLKIDMFTLCFCGRSMCETLNTILCFQTKLWP